MYFDFSNVLVFAGVAAFFILAALTFGRVVRPHRPDPEKLSTYECGEETIGTSWVRFNARFTVVALVFLIFDVEVAVLFPWAAIFKEPGVRLLALVEILLFMGILAVGFAYVWVKGDLGWLKSPVGTEKDRPGEAP
jgi:NADH-quinone oxidoreductase subunit A